MLSKKTQSVGEALNSAGAQLIRSVRLASGITLAEWRGLDTSLHYPGTPENVLSISLKGGSRCQHINNGKLLGHGSDDAVCLFPAGGSGSQWQITKDVHLLHIYFDRSLDKIAQADLSSVTGLSRGFREVFQERSPVISCAAQSIAHADWSNTVLSKGLDSMLHWIILNANREYGLTEERLEVVKGQLSRAQLKMVVEYLSENMSKVVRLDDLAGLCNLSRYHFLRKFKSTLGSAPHTYLTRMRMRYAHQLLSTSTDKITYIAFECGYNQPGQFATVFRRHFGYSPGDVRRQRLVQKDEPRA